MAHSESNPSTPVSQTHSIVSADTNPPRIKRGVFVVDVVRGKDLTGQPKRAMCSIKFGAPPQFVKTRTVEGIEGEYEWDQRFEFGVYNAHERMILAVRSLDKSAEEGTLGTLRLMMGKELQSNGERWFPVTNKTNAKVGSICLLWSYEVHHPSREERESFQAYQRTLKEESLKEHDTSGDVDDTPPRPTISLSSQSSPPFEPEPASEAVERFLLLRVERGRGFAHATDPLACPYVVCALGDRELRTRSQPLPHPVWGETLRFPLTKEQLRVAVYEPSSAGPDVYLGANTLNLGDQNEGEVLL